MRWSLTVALDDTLDETLPVAGEAAPWAADATEDAAAATRAMVGRAPRPGEPRARALEPVPPFAFLTMPEQLLG